MDILEYDERINVIMTIRYQALKAISCYYFSSGWKRLSCNERKATKTLTILQLLLEMSL